MDIQNSPLLSASGTQGTPSLKSFSIAQPTGTSMEKEIALLHRQLNLTFMASWLSLRSIRFSRFPPSHLADSPRSTGLLTLGSFRNPHGSSFQLPWTPVDLQPCPRYERQQHGFSMWFSLHSDGHRLVSSLPNSFKWLPHFSGRPWTRDLSPALQLTHLQFQAAPTCSPSFPLFIIPPFLCPAEFCVDPDIPSQ